jgi:uncharacterized protein (DUF58 family)
MVDMKWIAAAIALFALAIAFDLGLLVYAIYALALILFVAGLVTARWSGNVRIRRRISKTTADVGDTVDVHMEIGNVDHWPITWMLVEDLIPPQVVFRTTPALTIAGDRIAVLKFAGRQKHQLAYRMKCNRRGYFQIGPTVIETGDMFGFNRRYRVLSQPYYLLVYPQIIPLGGYDISSRRPIGEVIMTNRLF